MYQGSFQGWYRLFTNSRWRIKNVRLMLLSNCSGSGLHVLLSDTWNRLQCHVISRYLKSYHVISCHITLLRFASRYFTYYHVISCYFTLLQVISRHITLFHVLSRYFTSYHVISRYITLIPQFSVALNTTYRPYSPYTLASQRTQHQGISSLRLLM